MSSTKTPDFATVLRRALDARLEDLRVSLPARVERYDAAKQLIDAKPLLKVAHRDETDARVAESLPIIRNVPVLFPGDLITFPVPVGSSVLLVFSDRSLDVWLDRGGEVDPLDDRMHHLSDAFAIPGLRPFSSPIADVPTDATVLRGELRLGGADADDHAAVAEKLDGVIRTLMTIANSVVPLTFNPLDIAAFSSAASLVKVK